MQALGEISGVILFFFFPFGVTVNSAVEESLTKISRGSLSEAGSVHSAFLAITWQIKEEGKKKGHL